MKKTFIVIISIFIILLSSNISVAQGNQSPWFNGWGMGPFDTWVLFHGDLDAVTELPVSAVYYLQLLPDGIEFEDTSFVINNLIFEFIIDSLEPNSTYHQRMVLTNSYGVLNQDMNEFTTDAVSVKEYSSQKINLYPNPATNTLTIETERARGIYQLQDLTGKVLLSGRVTATKFSLDISTLSKGIYLLSLIDGEQQVNRKIVKE